MSGSFWNDSTNRYWKIQYL